MAGGTGGDARVIDTHTGRTLASYRLTGAPGYVDDVVLTQDAAWFTDASQHQFYKIPFTLGGQLPPQSRVVTVPLSGEMTHLPGEINGNGIATTPDGRRC